MIDQLPSRCCRLHMNDLLTLTFRHGLINFPQQCNSPVSVLLLYTVNNPARPIFIALIPPPTSSPSSKLRQPSSTSLTSHPTHLVGPAGCAGVLESTRTRRSIASGRRVSLRSASRRLSGRPRSLTAIFTISAFFGVDDFVLF